MDISTILIYIGVFFGIAFLTIIVLLIIALRRLKLRKKVRMIVITRDLKKRRRLVTPDSENLLYFDDGVYNYDEGATLKTFWNKDIYYFYGNPDPIRFNAVKQKIDITASNYKKAVKNNMISQLFSDGITSTIGIITIITLVLVVVVIVLLLFKGGGGATPEQVEEIVRNVLTGG